MTKKIIYSILIFITTYLLSYTISIDSKRHVIEKDINRLFTLSSHSWHDSIIKIKNIPIYIGRDTYGFVLKENYRLITENDTTIISSRLLNIKDIYEYEKRTTQTAMFECNEFDIRIADSIWNIQLRNAGYDCESSFYLAVKNIKDMFPRSDTLVTNIIVPFKSQKHIVGYDIFVTDSVGLGICNQAYAISYVNIPLETIIEKSGFMGVEFWVAIVSMFLYLVLASIKYKRKATKRYHTTGATENIEKESNCIQIQHLSYDTSTHILSNQATSQFVKLPRTQALLFETLIGSENYYATKKDICMRVWSLDEKSATNSYNSIARRMRDSFSEIDGIRLITIKDTAMQLLITKENISR